MKNFFALQPLKKFLIDETPKHFTSIIYIYIFDYTANLLYFQINISKLSKNAICVQLPYLLYSKHNNLYDLSDNLWIVYQLE